MEKHVAKDITSSLSTLKNILENNHKTLRNMKPLAAVRVADNIINDKHADKMNRYH